MREQAPPIFHQILLVISLKINRTQYSYFWHW